MHNDESETKDEQYQNILFVHDKHDEVGCSCKIVGWAAIIRLNPTTKISAPPTSLYIIIVGGEC